MARIPGRDVRPGRPAASITHGLGVQALDDVLTATVAYGDAPFVAAAVADREGTRWSGTAGRDEAGAHVRFDAVLPIYSQTKAIGATALLILVDRGLVSLDTPVAQVRPEFTRVRVLDSIDPDGPVLFEPGTEFAYGVGVDWIGPLVERLDGRRIDRFCAEEIFAPLGMTDTVFEPGDRPGRILAVRHRTADGGFGVVGVAPPEHPEVYGLGTCLYGTAADYLRFLRMVLGGGELDGRRILSAAAVELLKTNQMPAGLSVAPIFSDDHTWSCDINPFPEVPKTWTAGFLRAEADAPGVRAAGSLSWGGVLNTHYWVDPTNEVAAVFMTQSLPFVEPRLMDRFAQFERTVYQTLAAMPDEDER